MKKSGKAKSASTRKSKIQMCCDRVLAGAEKLKAMEAAFKETAANRPPAPKPERKRFGANDDQRCGGDVPVSDLFQVV